MRLSAGAEWWNIEKARCQFYDAKLGRRIIEAAGLFDYKNAQFYPNHFQFYKQVKVEHCLMNFLYYFA